MKKIIGLSVGLVLASLSYSQATYDNCADALANPITPGDPASCGETATPAGTEAGECLTNWAGNQNSTMWASFTATNDSMVINYVETTADGEMLKVYGPNSGCQPPCGDQIYAAQQVGDPGHHILLTGLTVGAVYLIQIDATDPNAPAQFSNLVYCFGVSEPSTNGLSSGANLIDECGTAFTETTDGGYWQSGTGTGFANLDGNGGTTCGGCIAGNDVSFVINNAAWNTFCSLTTGTWTITVDNVSNCQLTGAGVQAAVFTGTTGNLTNEGESSPVPGGGWTSPTITVNAGECAYLMIDGFAGDICEYDVTLTNITGGCVILSLEFHSLNVSQSNAGTLLNWIVSSEANNDKFIIERSYDNENYEKIGEVKSIGDHNGEHTYEFLDDRNTSREVYYRLSVVDNDGEVNILAIKYLKGESAGGFADLEIYPNPANDVLNVSYTETVKAGYAVVNIYTPVGILVSSELYETQLGINDLQFMLNDIDAGNYIVQIISNDRTVSKQFIKK